MNTLLVVAASAGVLCAALAVALWRAYALGMPATGLWAAMWAIGVAGAGGLVWYIGAGTASPARRSPYRRQAAAMQVAALGTATAVIVADGHEHHILAASATVMMLLFAATLVTCPDEAATTSAWIRRGLDGIFIASCLVFGVWVFVRTVGVTPQLLGEHYAVAVTAIAAAVMVCVGVVAAVRASGYRRRFVVMLVSAVLTGGANVCLVVAAMDSVPHWAYVGLASAWGLGCMTVAPAAWIARRRPGSGTAAPLPRLDLVVMAAPATVAAAAAVYHGVFHGPLGVDVVVLGLTVVAALAARQGLARVDVRRYAAELVEREAYYRSIVAGSSDVTTVLDANRKVRWQAASVAWIAASDRAAAIGQSFAELVHPDDAATVDGQLQGMLAGDAGKRIRVDARIMDASGKWRETESTVVDQRDVPQVRGIVLHTRDVGERRSLERELAKLAYTDALTTLSNRRALRRTLESDVAGGSMPCSLLAIDLDGFKDVNDSHGHDIGDAVLIGVADRLRNSLRPTDVAARLGGDEFAVLLWCGPEAAEEIAERVLGVLGEPYRFEGRGTVFLSTSIGIAGCAGADDVETLLRNADLALRAAKQRGKNRVEAYDATFERRLMRRSVLEKELHGAIARGELALVYQPVVSLPQRRVVGAEALMRWHNPQLGTVNPGEFIPVVEEAGLGEVLAEWTLRTVAERLAAWRAEGHAAWISMNLSVRQLDSPQFATALAQALLERGVPPSKLVVEVTEQDVAQDIDVLIAQLGALRGTGVRIALDDFGAGYSSLGQLHRLPVDILKIDRELVTGNDEDPAPLADVVVSLGNRLGLDTIAEGVETQAQLDVVQRAGCEMVQGYLLARPISVAEIDALLAEHAEVYKQSTMAIES